MSVTNHIKEIFRQFDVAAEMGRSAGHRGIGSKWRMMFDVVKHALVPVEREPPLRPGDDRSADSFPAREHHLGVGADGAVGEAEDRIARFLVHAVGVVAAGGEEHR